MVWSDDSLKVRFLSQQLQSVFSRRRGKEEEERMIGMREEE